MVKRYYFDIISKSYDDEVYPDDVEETKQDDEESKQDNE